MMRNPIPVLSVFYWGSVRDRKRTLSHHWFEQGKWHTALLFERAHKEPIWDGTIIFRRFSPNYRYYYEAAYDDRYHGDQTVLWVVGQRDGRLLKESAFACVFSPDSRWLAGCHQTYDDKIAFFELPAVRETVIRVRPYTYSHFCGWFPDSRYFWFGSLKGWYRLRTDNLRVRPERLSKQEYERLFRDWDLLNPRFRTDWATLEEREVFYCYALRGKARARAYPYVRASAPQSDALGQSRSWRPQTVEVQMRGGRRYEVVSNRDEREWLAVSAVSDDGRWVLVKHNRWNAQAQQEVVEWRLYEAMQRLLVRTWTEQEIPPYVELIELGVRAQSR